MYDPLSRKFVAPPKSASPPGLPAPKWDDSIEGYLNRGFDAIDYAGRTQVPAATAFREHSPRTPPPREQLLMLNDIKKDKVRCPGW